MTTHKRNTMGTTSGTGTVNPSGAPELTLCFCWVHVVQSLVFCVVLCRFSFYFWPLYCLQITISDSPFGTFNSLFMCISLILFSKHLWWLGYNIECLVFFYIKLNLYIPHILILILQIGRHNINVTFNNNSVISWWSVLLMEEIRVPGENHRPVTGHWQTLSRNVVSTSLYIDAYFANRKPQHSELVEFYLHSFRI